MKTKSRIAGITFLALGITQSIFAFSQSFQDSLKKDDQDIITSIAPYPQDVRDAILNVSQYSHKLVKIERIQARTSQSFQDLVADYPRDEQEKYYELARYPELIHQLVSGEPKTLEQVKPTLTNYPQEVSTAVSALFPMHLADLQAMDKIYQSSQKALDEITQSLPENVQSDFKKIVGMPEVMSLLTDRIDLVVSLGEAYKNDPQGTRQKLDSLSEQINAQNQKDLAEYKQQVENDPKMQEEMKKSAQDFADSYSANGEVQDDNSANQNQSQSQPTVVNNYYYSSNYNPNPYPYWFGYPYWYDYAMWYPRPLYYHTGFYIGTGGAIVVVGLPSRAYSGWFFSYGYHRYPRYYNYCNNYYNVHRTYVNNINVYHGFNSTVNRHFSAVGRNGGVRSVTNNRSEYRNNNFSRNNNVNRGSRENRGPVFNNNQGNSNQFRNSINNNNFNRQNYSNYHANQFHQQTWGNVGGNRGGFSGGGHSGFSGGGRSGGGGHSGGGHGRR
ncbi:MAG: hypothetical protein JSS79_07140 [Bacteroidetes bacterium]|nr:hypothetical protein [Bacteroidota bacterium]